MIDLLSTQWKWILIPLGLAIVYLFWSKIAPVFKRRGKKVTLRGSLRVGDVLYMGNGVSFPYDENMVNKYYDKDLHHCMYDELDIVEIIRLGQ